MEWMTPAAWALVMLGLISALTDLVVGSAGLLIAVGCILAVSGIAIAFTHSAIFGITVLGTTTIAVPATAWLMARLFPYTALGRSVLARSGAVDETSSSFNNLRALESLEGRTGIAKSYLRPSGVVEFDGRRIDCITEGMLVEPGERVRCLRVSSGRVLVRPLDPGETSPLASIDSDIFDLGDKTIPKAE